MMASRLFDIKDYGRVLSGLLREMHGPAVIRLDAWPPGAMVGTARKARSWSSKGSARGRCARGPGAGDAGGATRTNWPRWRSSERIDVQHVSGPRLAANAARTFLR